MSLNYSGSHAALAVNSSEFAWGITMCFRESDGKFRWQADGGHRGDSLFGPVFSEVNA